MVLSIIIILFIGIIAFFHYVQGFFSATISAMITIIAAVLAVSYHETVVNLLLKGKLADEAHAMVLCMIFAVVYIALRIMFDAAIPGNVRTPSTVDKVGAGLMGIVAGIFCTGIFAIAVQMLPFDATISFMGAPRYHTEGSKAVILPVAGARSLDSTIDEELTGNTLTPDPENPSADPAAKTGLLIPVDDIVLATVYRLSDGGSLAGDKSLASVHPDYLTELFGERLGVQPGGSRLTLNLGGNENVSVDGLFTAAKLPCFDGQISDIRPSGYKPLYKMEKIDKSNKDSIDKGEVKPAPDQRILIVRVKVKAAATADSDGLFRFSAGSVHLVGKGYDPNDHSNKIFKDFYPIGFMENGSAVLLDKPDDYLFIKPDAGFDAVFVVDDTLFSGGGKSDITLSPGVSITVKRFADLDLAGMDVSTTLTSDSSVEVIRSRTEVDRLKNVLPPPAPEAGSAAATAAAARPGNSGAPSNSGAPAPTPAPAVVSTPQPVAGKEVAQDISAVADNGFRVPGSVSLSTTASGDDVKDAPVAGGGTLSLNGGKIEAAKIDPTVALSELGAADNSYNKLFSPKDRAIVQVAMLPYQAGWDWVAKLGTIKVTDADGNQFSPNGFYQLAKTADSHGLFLRYNAHSQNMTVSSPDAAPEGSVYFIFLMPHGSTVKSFSMGGKTQDLPSPLQVP